MDKKYPLI